MDSKAARGGFRTAMVNQKSRKILEIQTTAYYAIRLRKHGRVHPQHQNPQKEYYNVFVPSRQGNKHV